MLRRFAPLIGLAVLVTVHAAPAAAARDWFVRAGSEGGDGSQAKPFSDPWQALEKCEAGDAIHVAAGKYVGKLGTGLWVIPFDGVQLVGGYDKDFATRDPWTNLTRLSWDPASKNFPREVRLGSQGKGVVVDGLVLDMSDSNAYTDDQKTGRAELPAGENAMRFTQAAFVRNCVIVNPGQHGISCVPGSTIENNLIVNSLDWGINVASDTGDFKKTTCIIKNNTILFSWCAKAPGKGRYSGSAIAVKGPSTITGNILAHNDNQALYLPYPAEKVTLNHNVFAMNLFANVKYFIEGRDVSADSKSMELLEEMGFKSCEGNEVADPKFDFDSAWLDQVSKRTAYIPGKVVMDDWNELRKLKGLPIIATGGAAASGLAPAMDLQKALLLLKPGNEAVKAGARRIKLEAKLSGASAAGPAKEYPKGDLASWARKPDTMDGKPLEMVVAVGGVANISTMPAAYDKTKILGFFLHDPDGKGERVTGFMMKGSNAERVCNDATGKYQGNGKPERLHVVKGVAYAVNNVPKGAFFVESILAYEAAGGMAGARPSGKDWFVRAGATGGNGSKEKPFRDPFQALEKVESGDTIHVAEGEYFGKLRFGNWKIDTTHISLIGGYDKEFKERNPWTHPTLLSCPPPDFKGRRGGYTVECGQDDHTGAVIDGFVFDKKPNNFYQASGDIEPSRSDNTEHIWVNRPDSAVRNCVFVNGAGGAIRTCNGVTVENNIFINHWAQTVTVESGHTTAPFVFRNNTCAFSWELKFGQGRGRNGHFLRLGGNVRAVVDNNIFEFADNDAIQLNADPREVSLTNNVFAHNLWSHVQKMAGNLVVDEKNWKQLSDFGFKALENNQLVIPGLPVDQAWFDRYLGRTAYVPGKVQMDDWNKVREMVGQPMIATGGKLPEGLMPAYDWKPAMSLFPKNAAVKAGARGAAIPVKFEGVDRKEETFEYAESSWDVAKDRTKWEELVGKRVMLKVAIKSTDNQWMLPDVKQEEYACFMAGGPEGSDSGLPMRCYVKKGTRFERAMKQAKGYGPGKPEEFHVIKGIARPNRQLVVEVIERAE